MQRFFTFVDRSMNPYREHMLVVLEERGNFYWTES